MKRVVLVAALLISCTAGSMIAQRRGGGPGPVNPFLGNDQAVREGESLYSQHCTTCHGAGGGGGEIGPAIVTSDRTALGVNARAYAERKFAKQPALERLEAVLLG